MTALLKHFIRSLIDWLFRRRSPALRIMGIGVSCLALTFGAGWALEVSFPSSDGRIDVGFDSAGGTPVIAVYLTGIVGSALIISGLILEMFRYRAERHRVARKKVIVIEVRGLRDGSQSSLINALPPRMKGHHDHVLVDLRQRVKDGEIVAPEAALEDLISGASAINCCYPALISF